LNTGASYHPGSDTWAPISTEGAPETRYRHTAVWTGDRMLIWGGNSGGGNELSTGGSYDPVTDHWTPTTTSNAPPPTDEHAAVWTGTRMIVWGGSAENVLNSGGVTSTVDMDDDGRCDTNDCDESNGDAWATPSEVPGLVFANRETLQWELPEEPGGVTPLYDTLRSFDPTDFVTATVCVNENSEQTETTDPDSPPANEVQYYLVRAASACPAVGSLGSGSDGVPRTGRVCP
jgi:hypothetical protein